MRYSEKAIGSVHIIVCDVCGKRSDSGARVKSCYICRKDVCRDCSIITDPEYLSPGSFIGDYPDAFCLDCWERGEGIRKDILACRAAADKEEDRLWENWRHSNRT